MTCVWAFSSEQKALTPSREGTGLGHARGAGGFSVSGRPETPKWLLFNHAWMYTPHVTVYMIFPLRITFGNVLVIM